MTSLRIAIVNHTHRKVGGTEHYLESLGLELHALGHKIALVTEEDTPSNREPIQLPEDIPNWCAATQGADSVVHALAEWKPDLIYAHGDLSDAFEERILSLAPSIYFVHNYHGTCISGEKTHKFPIVQPCDRVLGPACLAYYFPRRCGGLNPFRMWELYGKEQRRLARLKRYDLLVTHSDHMRNEYLHHGFAENRIHFVHYATVDDHRPEPPVLPLPPVWQPVELLFSGRMEKLKGGKVLLDALPAVQAALLRPVQLTLVGDGREMNQWAEYATAISSPLVSVKFAGWKKTGELNALYKTAHLLVVPSLWPEPFGRIGSEAGMFGLPSIAFNVGGVTTWLTEGVNGHMAPGNPPTVDGLAQAIISCLRDNDHYLQLRKGAFEVSQRFTMARHLTELLPVFSTALDLSKAAK